MRVIGLDVGDKTIGVAISDALKYTAQGIETIARKNITLDIDRIVKLITDYEVDTIVIGMPRNMNGTYGERSQITERFAHKLKTKLDIPIVFQDERLSTVAAERVLLDADMSRSKRKKVIDKLAAVIILQAYLDALAQKNMER